MQLTTGMLLAKSGPDADRVFLTIQVPRRGLFAWIGRPRLVTYHLTPGEARTVAAALNQAVHRLHVKRGSR